MSASPWEEVEPGGGGGQGGDPSDAVPTFRGSSRFEVETAGTSPRGSFEIGLGQTTKFEPYERGIDPTLCTFDETHLWERLYSFPKGRPFPKVDITEYVDVLDNHVAEMLWRDPEPLTMSAVADSIKKIVEELEIPVEPWQQKWLEEWDAERPPAWRGDPRAAYALPVRWIAGLTPPGEEVDLRPDGRIWAIDEPLGVRFDGVNLAALHLFYGCDGSETSPTTAGERCDVCGTTFPWTLGSN